MKTVTVPIDFTFLDFLRMHSLGLLVCVVLAMAGAWVFAKREA
jgi:hypothetical protein